MWKTFFLRRSERRSVGPRREKQRSTIEPSNAEIKPGNQFDRFDRADNFARLVGLFIATVSFRWACAPRWAAFWVFVRDAGCAAGIFAAIAAPWKDRAQRTVFLRASPRRRTILSLRNHGQMLHGPRLRNRGGKREFVTVIIINDHYGFAFDFYFVRRDPASAAKRGKHNFANLVYRCVKSFRDLGFKNGV